MSSSTSPTIREIRPQPGPQLSFLTCSADIAIYGGAAGGGKTWALLLEPLRHVENPDFGAVVFRRTSPQITSEGGLWSESEKLYPHAGAWPVTHVREWRFPSGATVSFRHLQHDKDKLAWQGAQVALICFDELTHFEESQFWYLLSRNRSMCGVRPFIRATCNPDADSWVARLLAWWIDQDTGLPITARAGRVRWFVRSNDQLVWADTPEELQARHPGIPPKSLAFIPAKLSDNAALMAADPGYLANLLALPLVERERLLGGNWEIRPAAGLIFNRGWFRIVEAVPAGTTDVRYWDKAATEDGGDWTVGVRMGRATDGVYYVKHVVRGQWSPLQREQTILGTAKLDGHGVCIWLEQEPGSAGLTDAENTVRLLAGYAARIERVTGDKLTRARALSAQCEVGNVRLVAGEWNGAYLDELHSFPEGAHDDQVDGSSGAFNQLVAMFTGTWDPAPPEAARSVWTQHGEAAGADGFPAW